MTPKHAVFLTRGNASLKDRIFAVQKDLKRSTQEPWWAEKAEGTPTGMKCLEAEILRVEKRKTRTNKQRNIIDRTKRE